MNLAAFFRFLWHFHDSASFIWPLLFFSFHNFFFPFLSCDFASCLTYVLGQYVFWVYIYFFLRQRKKLKGKRNNCTKICLLFEFEELHASQHHALTGDKTLLLWTKTAIIRLTCSLVLFILISLLKKEGRVCWFRLCENVKSKCPPLWQFYLIFITFFLWFR